MIEKLVQRAVVNVFNRHFSLSELVGLVERFEAGAEVEVGESVASDLLQRTVAELPELSRAVGRLDLGESPAGVASGVEFVLEGLHLNRRLNKERRGGGVRYAR